MRVVIALMLDKRPSCGLVVDIESSRRKLVGQFAVYPEDT
jgi:hypothetical protein